MNGRIDVISIFPEFFSVLDLSLMGKAQEKEHLTFQAHDLRTWATDRHRTVDDSPYGGGAGMVMKPDVWGEAIDAVATDPMPTLLIPTPAGQVLNQAHARELARELAQGTQIIIACGRYEGIDARVGEHYLAQGWDVQEFSIGDYVLNGGEVAAVVLIEAVGRLVPGVVGNPDSLVEESHESNLLEYRSYTTPAQWRGLEVPEVLRSGHHGRVEEWRRTESVIRTAQRRPDLLESVDLDVRKARASDVPMLAEVAALTFRLACPPDFPEQQAQEFVAENLSEAKFRGYIKSKNHVVFVATIADVIVGYSMVVTTAPTDPDVQAAIGSEPATELSKFYVRPEFHGRGVSSQLMAGTAAWVQARASRQIWLGVNQQNKRAQKFYEKCGFRAQGSRTFDVGGRIEQDFVMVRDLAAVPQMWNTRPSLT